MRGSRSAYLPFAALALLVLIWILHNLPTGTAGVGALAIPVVEVLS